MNELLRAFDILGVQPGSDDATLRTAWRALVRTYHPDMAKTDLKAANQRLAEINAAWDLIGSSTEKQVQQLQKIIAKKRHAEMTARRQRARAAFRAAQEQKLRAEIRAKKRSADSDTPVDAQSDDGVRSEARTATHTVASFGADGSAENETSIRTPITALARRAFETARIVCSPVRHSAPRPFYM